MKKFSRRYFVLFYKRIYFVPNGMRIILLSLQFLVLAQGTVTVLNNYLNFAQTLSKTSSKMYEVFIFLSKAYRNQAVNFYVAFTLKNS